MTVTTNQQELLFSPTLISNIINTFKNRVIDIRDRTIFSTLHKMVSVALEESLTMKKYFLTARVEFGIEEMEAIDFDKLYDHLEETEENLWVLHKQFEQSTNAYEMQLFDLVDSTLDNFAVINNVLGYFESQIIQKSRASA